MTKKLSVTKSSNIGGSVSICGAKNAALPILFASLLNTEKMIVSNIPKLSDIDNTIKILEHFGTKVKWLDNKTLEVNPGEPKSLTAPREIVSTMRASILSVPAILSKHKKIIFNPPGGCQIGERPIDLHIKALEALGAEIKIVDDNLHLEAPELKGCDFEFSTVSVGATETMLIAASFAIGTTKISNAAKEPEVIDLINFLNKMGANIEGAGTSTIIVHGANKKQKIEQYSVIADRIEAISYAILGLFSAEGITINNINKSYMENTLDVLAKIGAKITYHNEESITIKKGKINAYNLETKPYPDFPTDAQPQFMLVLNFADDVSMVKENIFENRFMHVDELNKMGANIEKLDKNTAKINPIQDLQGTDVYATDLRAGFALIIAGILANGETIIHNVYHIERGYSNFIEKLLNCGINIKYI